MKIKKQSIQKLVGEVEINRVFERIKKVYPNTAYFNPFDPNYNGVSMSDHKPLDGFRIKNILSGYVMTIKDKDVSDKKIHININAEIYHIGMIYIETFFTLDDWCIELEDFDGIIIKDDKDESLVSPQGRVQSFLLTDLMPLEKIGPLDDEHYNYGSTDKREVDKIIYDKYGLTVDRIGTSMGAAILSWGRTPYIILDEDKKISINQDKDEKISDKFDIYKIKDKDDIYHTVEAEVFDKACKDIKKDFIKVVFLLSQHGIASAWFSQIADKSKVILESIDNPNEVYWQNLRIEIEGWQLKFLTFHSNFHRDLSTYFQYLKGDDIFNKEIREKWTKERKEQRKEVALLYDEIKYALNNLATPGHTHDEQLLQKETEKVNERILLLSFLAMSIPMIGAVLTPTLSLNLKLMSGFVVFSLPVLYIATRKVAFRRNKNLNTKSFLKSEAKDLTAALERIEDRKKGVRDYKEIPDDMKAYYLNLMDKMKKSQSKKLDKMSKKIKSL